MTDYTTDMDRLLEYNTTYFVDAYQRSEEPPAFVFILNWSSRLFKTCHFFAKLKGVASEHSSLDCLLLRLVLCGIYVQDKQCRYKCKIEKRSCKHCCSVKTISITYSEYVFVALHTGHATRMSRIVICGLASSTYFSILSHKRHGLRENNSEHKMFYDFIYNIYLERVSF